MLFCGRCICWFYPSSEVALLCSLKGRIILEIYIKNVYKIIHWVLVFGGGVSQYKPVEGFCFYVVVVVLGGIFVSWQKGEINFFFSLNHLTQNSGIWTSLKDSPWKLWVVWSAISFIKTISFFLRRHYQTIWVLRMGKSGKVQQHALQLATLSVKMVKTTNLCHLLPFMHPTIVAQGLSVLSLSRSSSIPGPGMVLYFGLYNYIIYIIWFI